jgi:acetamidase/formamidase
LYYPVAVPGCLFSIGDSHASQGYSELRGTAIACSLTSIAVDFGVTRVVDGNWGIRAIIKKSLFAGASV